MSRLAENLKYFRELRNLKQDDIGEHVQKSRSVISNWEKGINRPDADTISAICELLEISPNDLFGWNEDNKTKAPTSQEAGEAMRLLLHYRFNRQPTKEELELFSAILPVLVDGVKNKGE